MIEVGWFASEVWLSPDVCWKVGGGASHTIWQGAVAMLIAAALIRFNYPNLAQIRFCLLLGLLLLVGLQPACQFLLAFRCDSATKGDSSRA